MLKQRNQKRKGRELLGKAVTTATDFKTSSKIDT
jgi:hypothetical protein